MANRNNNTISTDIFESVEVAVECWFMRRVPSQTSKRNTKSIFSAISSQKISGKNSESEDCHEKYVIKSLFRSGF